MTRYLRLAALFGALVIVLSLAVACGGDDDDSGNNGTGNEPTTASTRETGSTSPTEEPAGEADEDDSDEGLFERFQEAAANRPDTYLARYEMRSSDPEEGEFTGTMTLAAKSAKEMFDLAYTDADGTGSMRVIIEGSTTIICVEEAETGDEGTCFSMGGGVDDSPFASLTAIFGTADELLNEIAEDDGLDVKRAGSKRVAGLDSDCYDVTGPDTEGTVCIAKDENLMVEVDGTFEGMETLFRLTEYTNNPGDDLFEPPFEVTSLTG